MHMNLHSFDSTWLPQAELQNAAGRSKRIQDHMELPHVDGKVRYGASV